MGHGRPGNAITGRPHKERRSPSVATAWTGPLGSKFSKAIGAAGMGIPRTVATAVDRKRRGP
jgi:hypothetical protein